MLLFQLTWRLQSRLLSQPTEGQWRNDVNLRCLSATWNGLKSAPFVCIGRFFCQIYGPPSFTYKCVHMWIPISHIHHHLFDIHFSHRGEAISCFRRELRREAAQRKLQLVPPPFHRKALAFVFSPPHFSVHFFTPRYIWSLGLNVTERRISSSWEGQWERAGTERWREDERRLFLLLRVRCSSRGDLYLGVQPAVRTLQTPTQSRIIQSSSPANDSKNRHAQVGQMAGLCRNFFHLLRFRRARISFSSSWGSKKRIPLM